MVDQRIVFARQAIDAAAKWPPSQQAAAIKTINAALRTIAALAKQEPR